MLITWHKIHLTYIYGVELDSHYAQTPNLIPQETYKNIGNQTATVVSVASTYKTIIYLIDKAFSET